VGGFLSTRLGSDYGSRFLIGEEQLVRVQLVFENHAGVIVLASLIPGARTLASFPAGAAKMSLSRFTIYPALGCFDFNAALVYAGDYLGSNWSAVKRHGKCSRWGSDRRPSPGGAGVREDAPEVIFS
jgi:membrane protein DedA with SNARE-associated domain